MAISINLYLDNRFNKQKGNSEEQEYPIKISITKDGSTAYLSTGIKVLTKHWKNHKVTGRKDKARLNDFLESSVSRVKHLIYEGLDDGEYHLMSATEIKNDISARLGKVDSHKPSTLFFAIYDQFAESRSSERTKEIYRVTGRKLRQLLPSPDKLRIEQIDLTWLGWRSWMICLEKKETVNPQDVWIFGTLELLSTMPKNIKS